MRRALAFLAILWAACAGPQGSRVSPDQLEDALRSARVPVVVYLWADWSRDAVELLPTAAELAAEYESSVVFWTVSLGESDLEPKGFPSSSRHFTLEEDPTVTLSRLGLQDIPAALLYAPNRALRLTLGPSDLTPTALTDAIESLTDSP